MFETPDLHLATWLMCQGGTECSDIKTQRVRHRNGADSLQSAFVLDTARCARSLDALLDTWRKGEALVEPKHYEQERHLLLANMYQMHAQFKET